MRTEPTRLELLEEKFKLYLWPSPGKLKYIITPQRSPTARHFVMVHNRALATSSLALDAIRCRSFALVGRSGLEGERIFKGVDEVDEAVTYIDRPL